MEACVYRVRKKRESCGCTIRTIRAMGYLMERFDGES